MRPEGAHRGLSSLAGKGNPDLDDRQSGGLWKEHLARTQLQLATGSMNSSSSRLLTLFYLKKIHLTGAKMTLK